MTPIKEIRPATPDELKFLKYGRHGEELADIIDIIETGNSVTIEFEGEDAEKELYKKRTTYITSLNRRGIPTTTRKRVDEETDIVMLIITPKEEEEKE